MIFSKGLRQEHAKLAKKQNIARYLKQVSEQDRVWKGMGLNRLPAIHSFMLRKLNRQGESPQKEGKKE